MNPVAESSNRAEDAYRQLRQRIVFGDLAPNAVLVEADVAEELGLSRTPIREAFQRLASDGLIVSHRRRWYVRQYDWRDVEEIYEVRSAHEGLAARLAALRSDTETHDRLTMLKRTAQQDRAIADPTAWVIANDRFHSTILELSGNDRLRGIIDRTKVYYFNRSFVALYTEVDRDRSSLEHVAIVEAVMAGESDRAERLARDHVLAALDMVRSSAGRMLVGGTG